MYWIKMGKILTNSDKTVALKEYTGTLLNFYKFVM